MCRLFGLHADGRAVTATFWLLEAPDNLADQSRRNPDGTGLGVFRTDGTPVVRKKPEAAWRDVDFATAAHALTGTTFIAHVRYATTGSRDVLNTHPFLQDGRIFAHNGVVKGLDILNARLNELGVADLVHGQTDSERVFALITASIRRHDGDISAGIEDGLRWLSGNVPIYALNLLLATATDLWALRYPDTHPLYMLDRGSACTNRFDMRSTRISTHSTPLATEPSVVFATEEMDDEPWQLLQSGELVHIDAGLQIHKRMVLPDAPAQQISRSDLSAKEDRAQHPAGPPPKRAAEMTKAR